MEQTLNAVEDSGGVICVNVNAAMGDPESISLGSYRGIRLMKQLQMYVSEGRIAGNLRFCSHVRKRTLQKGGCFFDRIVSGAIDENLVGRGEISFADYHIYRFGDDQWAAVFILGKSAAGVQ